MTNKLCSKCKTGYESLKLDPKSVECPFLIAYKGDNCVFYKPLTKESESDTNEGV